MTLDYCQIELGGWVDNGRRAKTYCGNFTICYVMANLLSYCIAALHILLHDNKLNMIYYIVATLQYIYGNLLMAICNVTGKHFT